MHNKFVIENWVNLCNFIIDYKKLEKIGMRGEVISI